jgi:Rrf2 family protein
MTYLAQRQGDGRHYLARDMAELLGMPAPFLGKVLQPLVTQGFLHSQRGRSGGFRLDRPAAEVFLVQIVEAEETLAPANACLLGQRDCDEAHACPLHATWMQTSNAFHETLRRTSLAHMVAFGADNPGCVYPLPSRPVAKSPLLSLPNLRDDQAVSA